MANLRELAERDLGTILETTDGGFGRPVVLTDPSGTSATIDGMTGNISNAIDPETGAEIVGDFPSVTLRISSILAAGLAMPVQEKHTGATAWRVSFEDLAGTTHTFRVQRPEPDYTLGFVNLKLERI